MSAFAAIVVSGASMASALVATVIGTKRLQESEERTAALVVQARQSVEDELARKVESTDAKLARTVESTDAKLARTVESADAKLARTVGCIQDDLVQLRGADERVGEDVTSLKHDMSTLGSSFEHKDGHGYARGGTPDSRLHVGDQDTAGVHIARHGAHVSIGEHSHFNHPHGNTYIRAPKPGGNVMLAEIEGQGLNAAHALIKKPGKNGDVNLRGGADGSKLHIGDSKTAGVNIALDGKAQVRVGGHTHFNYPDGNTYLRPARSNGKVVISDMAGNGFNASGAFVKDGGRGAALRSGSDKLSLFIADSNTGTTYIARDPKRRVQVGPYSYFNTSSGSTYIRPSRTNGNVYIGSTRWPATRRVTVEAKDGLCIGRTCLNEAALKKVLAEIA